jgi:hypothetical protein
MDGRYEQEVKRPVLPTDEMKSSLNLGRSLE